MPTIGIYKIENKINGNVYVGQSTNIFKRWSVHGNKNKAKNCNMAIAKAITKHGVENFRFDILEICSKEELNSREKYWVSFYDSYKKGYNSTTGGDSLEEVTFSKLDKEKVNNLYKELADNIVPMTELAKKYNVTEGTIRSVNTGDSWASLDVVYPIRNGNTAYLNSIKCKKVTCVKCSKTLEKCNISGFCLVCLRRENREKNWPNRYKLISHLLHYPNTKIGEMYNVSDSAVKKWCKKYNIPSNKRHYKKLIWSAYPDSNREQILRRDLVYPVNL